MSAFVWTLIVFMALSAIGKLVWLSRGHAPARKLWQEAVDVAINAALIAWGLVVVIGGAA